MEWLLKIAEQYGLFVTLVVYVIWDSRNREGRYLNTIDGLSQNLGIVGDIQKDVDEIKEDIKIIARR
jgi:cyanophycinase-like exopeptidase